MLFRSPLTATSRGVGEVIAAALDAGCRRLVLGVGGSASTDGGLGMVQALGARVTDAAGDDVGPGGLGAQAAAELDVSGLHPGLAEATVEVACDVDNPLTGPHGAAETYGPMVVEWFHPDTSPEAKEAFEEIAGFFDKHLGK